MDHRNFSSRQKFEDKMQSFLELHNVELIALAGFMRILTADFVSKVGMKLGFKLHLDLGCTCDLGYTWI